MGKLQPGLTARVIVRVPTHLAHEHEEGAAHSREPTQCANLASAARARVTSLVHVASSKSKRCAVCEVQRTLGTRESGPVRWRECPGQPFRDLSIFPGGPYPSELEQFMGAGVGGSLCTFAYPEKTAAL